MFKKKQQTQPKEAYEQPEIVNEEVHGEEQSQEETRTAKADPDLMWTVRRYKSNPSIISKVWK